MIEGIVFGDRVMNYVNTIEIVCQKQNLLAII